jgi:ribonuclease T2
MLHRRAALACALTLAVQPAFAASDCLLDNCADRPSASHRSYDGQSDRSWRRNGSGPRGSSTPGQFDFYVLSLSWSPGFCATGGDEKGRDQCRVGSGVGFTVHGLWPQYNRGYPSDCNGSARYPSRAALAQTDGVYPDERLARYEWRKHGTCTGLSPTDYFALARQARDAVVIPDAFKGPHDAQSMAPLAVERAFTEANPRLRPGMVAAVCKDATLDEVRICFSKDLKGFQVCPEVVRGRCRAQAMTVPPLR